MVSHLYAVMVASVVGFAGNEAAAVIRIRVGKEIESAASSLTDTTLGSTGSPVSPSWLARSA